MARIPLFTHSRDASLVHRMSLSIRHDEKLLSFINDAESSGWEQADQFTLALLLARVASLTPLTFKDIRKHSVIGSSNEAYQFAEDYLAWSPGSIVAFLAQCPESHQWLLSHERTACPIAVDIAEYFPPDKFAAETVQEAVVMLELWVHTGPAFWFDGPGRSSLDPDSHRLGNALRPALNTASEYLSKNLGTEMCSDGRRCLAATMRVLFLSYGDLRDEFCAPSPVAACDRFLADWDAMPVRMLIPILMGLRSLKFPAEAQALSVILDFEIPEFWMDHSRSGYASPTVRELNWNVAGVLLEYLSNNEDLTVFEAKAFFQKFAALDETQMDIVMAACNTSGGGTLVEAAVDAVL